MNGKLEGAIKAEIGKDDGRELPDVADFAWDIDKWTYSRAGIP